MKFSLGRLNIQNFKAIQNDTFDLRDFQTIILDGPNGFGKTTIFDALEICFTGRINRISASKAGANTKAHDCYFLKREASLITSITLEIKGENEEDSFVIKSEIAANITGSAASVRKYTEQINRYISNSWEAPSWKNLTNAALWNRLQLLEGENLFSIQHYISQEESVSFLRDYNESERHKVLSHLFGTTEQSNELAALASAKELLAQKVNELNSSKEVAQQKLNEISSEQAKVDELELEASSSGHIDFIDTLVKADYPALADVSSALECLRVILPIIEAPESYRDHRFNELIDVFLTDRDTEIADLISEGRVENSAELYLIENKQKRLASIFKRKQQYESTLDIIDQDKEALQDDVLDHIASLYYLTSQRFVELKDLFKAKRNSNTGISKTLQQLQNHRKSLLLSYQQYQEHSNHDVACPLCGDLKEGQFDQLLDEFNRQENFFASLSSDAAKLEAKLKQEITEQFILPLTSRISSRVTRLSWLSAQLVANHSKRKPSDINRFNRMSKVRTWLNNNNIDFEDLVDPIPADLTDDYDSKSETLKTRVRESKKILPIDSSIDTGEIKQSYQAIGIKNDEELLGLSKGLVEADIKLCEAILRKLKNAEAKSLREQITKLSRLYKVLNEKLISTETSIKIYSDNIKRYEIQVASSIAIPFYVYTSKILQTRPDGSGIFLRTPTASSRERNPYIRFCARINDSHDAWCTMSSGQLAGLVIAFALAMNRLYPSQLSSILIDDPIQSMDEVNMASLVQLLLHEFPEHQFFVSTHERNVSSYMSYKFTHQGKNVLHVNMKDRSQQS